MSYAGQMLGAIPGGIKVDANVDVLAEVIDALGDCAQACAADTDADLSEQNLAEMVPCIRLCEDCADVCAATARVLSRPARWDARFMMLLLEACVAVCRSCGDECERHAPMHGHCRVCAAACFRCEQTCRGLLDVMT